MNLIKIYKIDYMNLIIILLVLITIYSLYKLKNHKENFNVNTEQVNKEIKENLDNVNDNKEKHIDISVLKELSNLAKTLNEDGLTINGDLKITGKFNQIPSGFITMWYPKGGKKNAYSYTEIKAEIPEGWVLCDGTNGTLDLRGRFVRMYSNNMQENDSYVRSSTHNLNTFTKENNVHDKLKSHVSKSKSDNKTEIVEMKVGTEGGTDHKNLHINELPAHKHDVKIKHGHGFFKIGEDIGNHRVSERMDVVKFESGGDAANAYDRKSGVSISLKDALNDNYSHSVDEKDRGNSGGFNVVPPFFTVVYIQKV